MVVLLVIAVAITIAVAVVVTIEETLHLLPEVLASVKMPVRDGHVCGSSCSIQLLDLKRLRFRSEYPARSSSRDLINRWVTRRAGRMVDWNAEGGTAETRAEVYRVDYRSPR